MIVSNTNIRYVRQIFSNSLVILAAIGQRIFFSIMLLVHHIIHWLVVVTDTFTSPVFVSFLKIVRYRKFRVGDVSRRTGAKNTQWKYDSSRSRDNSQSENFVLFRYPPCMCCIFAYPCNGTSFFKAATDGLFSPHWANSDSILTSDHIASPICCTITKC